MSDVKSQSGLEMSPDSAAEAAEAHKQLGFLLPVVLIDYTGRKVVVNAPVDTPFIAVGMDPIGAFLFDRTERIDPETLKMIYQQRMIPTILDQAIPIEVIKES